jgi:hypothetical protein
MPFIAGLANLNMFSRRIVRLPSAPTSVAASINGVGSIGVSYSTPSDTGGTAIIKYQYSTNGGSTWTDAPASPFSLTGLGNGTAITVTMRAVNLAGIGASASSSTTTATVPGTPSVSITSTSTNNAYSWTAPSSGGLAITGYEYALSTDGGSSYPGNTGPSLSTTYSVSNDKVESTYRLRVRACNAVGCGGYGTADSNNWERVVGSNYTVTQNGTIGQTDQWEACASTCSSTGCGTQPRARTKYRQATLRNDVIYWPQQSGATTSHTYTGIIVTDYPAWNTVSTFNTCADNGAATNTARTAYSATSEGQVISIQDGQYATWSGSIYGAWYRSDASGNAVSCGTGGCGNACVQVTNSIEYCSVGGCQTYTRTAAWSGSTICASPFGLYVTSCTPTGC